MADLSLMTSFWLIALVLGAGASAFVLLPLFLRRDGFLQDREGINVGLYEERLSELESQRAEGQLAEADFTLLKTELQQNLLSDTGDESGKLIASVGIGKLPMVLALLVPAFAFFAYADLGLSWGALTDLEISQELQTDKPHGDGMQLSTVDKLAMSMKQQPENHEGLFMVAQSYLKLSQFEKAAAAFENLFSIYPGDARLASYIAESLFLADKRKITPRVEAAIQKTLALNPHDIGMLEIKGMDAFVKGDLETSLEYFNKAAVTAEGRRAESIKQAIERVELALGRTPSDMAEARVDSKEEVSSTGRVIQVLVEVAESVKVDSSSQVFIFAKAISGPPMPLAVKKLNVAGLPTLVQLDESMAMMKGMGLANFDQVQVVARISSSGIANSSPDDYEIKSGRIDLTAPVPVIKLKIEKKIRDQ
jgi:cytochrome c-type biogenesis protein CcmH